MSEALWAEDNHTQCSSPFSISAGYVCLLRAAGMRLYKYRADASEPQGKQLICVRQLVYAKAVKPEADTCSCGRVFDPDSIAVPLISDCPVKVDGCPWVLSCNRSIGIIGVPGTYRLDLNDPTAIGDVQVFAEWYRIDQIAPQVAHLFF